jgi:GntR family carbon starvation induced transcriptional regulator
MSAGTEVDGLSSSGTVARYVHAQMRADILTGSLKPGQRLRIGELAARYDCGAIPLREALNRLAGERLVLHSQQRGFAVAAISMDDFADLARARSMIGEIAMRESIAHGDAQWEEGILLAQHRLSKISRYLSVEPPVPNPHYDCLHREFHSALFNGCNSKRMIYVAEELFDHAERYRHFSRTLLVTAREDEHAAIVRAALGRNSEEAVRLIKEHVERTYQIVADLGGLRDEPR